MTALAHRDDHVEQGLARLTSMYADKPRIKGLVQSYVAGVQGIEDANHSRRFSLDLDNAGDSELDVLGRILLREREGRDDDTYRKLLIGETLVRASSGRADELIAIAQAVAPGGVTVLYRDTSLRSAVIELRGVATPNSTGSALAEMLTRASAGGVATGLIWTSSAPAGALLLVSSAGTYGTSGLGSLRLAHRSNGRRPITDVVDTYFPGLDFSGAQNTQYVGML